MITKTVNMILIFLFITSTMFMIFSYHPLTLGMMVITQCLITSAMLSFWHKFSWFSFFITIIYLGGILMLFSYIISLTFSKEPMIKLPKKYYYSTIPLYIYLFNSLKNDYMEQKKMNFESVMQSSFSSSMKMSIFLFTLLLILMIMVVFLTESNKGNMRTL
uniref:NADH dehydrogenase subunit 6 n=1 Tax=Taeniothrips tigris TaxID=2824824 RepID=A0A8A9WN46_9NEOP|nr:NADH dehydrogenase subunit 6 [Taeniothrips tigris]QTT60743.1 NADH dehydrogenase subunit 6 [Taeniothrips tigris]